MASAGVVFNIQRFSIHDGPGIRTTVFLKGCPLSCFWCHNPEGRHAYAELQYHPDRCIACGACVEACPNHAHALRDGVHVFDRDRCRNSFDCVATCYSNALEIAGRAMTVDQVMEEVLRDRAFYHETGGVTLSGGEPALAGDFAGEVLARSKAEGLHTAIETCGACQWSALEALLPVTDLVMMDLKVVPSGRHKEVTGAGNDRILENARRLARTEKPLIFRTPIVPSVNDSEGEIQAIVSFLKELAGTRPGNGSSGGATLRYELLPFHRLASDKYASLGMTYTAASLHPPTRDTMERLLTIARSNGLDARIGG
jgi:pyruvate formate lyase activating enzyme